VIIDGSGDRQFKQNLSAYIRRHAQTGAVRQVSLKNSASEPLLQLADMCVGAIARAHRPDERRSTRWSDRLAGKVEKLWELK